MEPLVIDLDSDESIESAAEAVRSKFGRLDSLINNAGATYDIDYCRGKTSLRDSFNDAYNTNVVSTSNPPAVLKLRCGGYAH